MLSGRCSTGFVGDTGLGKTHLASAFTATIVRGAGRGR